MRLGLLLATGSCALAFGGCGGQTYWYCWDSGDPSPHHLGHTVDGDHLCSDQELKENPP